MPQSLVFQENNIVASVEDERFTKWLVTKRCLRLFVSYKIIKVKCIFTTASQRRCLKHSTFGQYHQFSDMRL